MKYLSLLSLFLVLLVVAGVEHRAHPDDVEKEIDDLIRSHRLMVFSKTYCPYSKRAKKLLGETLGAKNMEVLEIDERDDMDKIQVSFRNLITFHLPPPPGTFALHYWQKDSPTNIC